jgi:dTDP-4-amino-4,6-dideoxy-D-glucose acyltransferase
MFLNSNDLLKIGFKSIGQNVLISDKVSIYNPENISIGNNVRIDDFVVLSSKIIIGNYIHIGCYSSLIGKEEIIIKDFCGISGRVSIYSSNDDYTGLAMTNPTIPIEYRRVINEKVILNKHVIIGSGSVILPGVEIGEGTSIGSLSLVKENCDEFSVYFGNPIKKIGNRMKRFLKYEKNFT